MEVFLAAVSSHLVCWVLTQPGSKMVWAKYSPTLNQHQTREETTTLCHRFPMSIASTPAMSTGRSSRCSISQKPAGGTWGPSVPDCWPASCFLRWGTEERESREGGRLEPVGVVPSELAFRVVSNEDTHRSRPALYYQPLKSGRQPGMSCFS